LADFDFGVESNQWDGFQKGDGRARRAQKFNAKRNEEDWIVILRHKHGLVVENNRIEKTIPSITRSCNRAVGGRIL
jgi:hypothetical protein